MKIVILFLSLFYLSTGLFGQQMEFKLKGNWNYTVSASEIIEAGNDFVGTYESDPRQIDLDFRIKPNNWNFRIEYTWTMDIHKLDTDWHPDIEVYARVTDQGKGFGINPYMVGGEVYQRISDVSQQFFYGSAARRNIKIQYELRGISVTLPAKSYSTTIVYTFTSTY